MLKKQMKGMSLTSESRDKKKIDLKDSDSSSEDEGMQVDQVSSVMNKQIKKKVFSRAQHAALKKEIRKRRKMSQIGIKGSRRKAQELTEIRE